MVLFREGRGVLGEGEGLFGLWSGKSEDGGGLGGDNGDKRLVVEDGGR